MTKGALESLRVGGATWPVMWDRSKRDEDLGRDDVLAERVRDVVLVVPALAHGLVEVCLGEHLGHGGQVEPRAQVVGDEAEDVDGRAVVLDGEIPVAWVGNFMVRGRQLALGNDVSFHLCTNQSVSRYDALAPRPSIA